MKKPKEYLNTSARTVADWIELEFSATVYAHTKNRVLVVTSLSRPKFYEALRAHGFERDTSMSGSSQGGMRKEGVEVIHKLPEHSTGRGKENEKIFLEEAQKHLQGPTGIVLWDDKGRQISAIGDTLVDASASGALQYSKSDADLLLEGELILGISLKKEGSTRWDSGKTRFAKLYQTFLEKAKTGEIENLQLSPRTDTRPGTYWMLSDQGVRYGRVIIENMPKDSDEDMVFGVSSAPVVVAQRSFTSENFCFRDSFLYIHVQNLYRNMEEIYQDGKQPVVAFGHHAGKENGIELRAFPASEAPGLNSSTLYIPYSQLI